MHKFRIERKRKRESANKSSSGLSPGPRVGGVARARRGGSRLPFSSRAHNGRAPVTPPRALPDPLNLPSMNCCPSSIRRAGATYGCVSSRSRGRVCVLPCAIYVRNRMSVRSSYFLYLYRPIQRLARPVNFPPILRHGLTY